MTSHNDTVNYLVLQGWEYDANAGDGCSFQPANSDEWYTLKQALSIEREENPDSYREFELVTNLDPRYANMFSHYMEN
jgi:hypothetical protein